MKVSIIPWIVKKLKLGLALVEDGDTASQNIASGKYVSWKGNMCQASSAISSGDALSSSNLTAVEGGALNALNEKIPSVRLTSVDTELAVNSQKTFSDLSEYQIVIVAFYAQVTGYGARTFSVALPKYWIDANKGSTTNFFNASLYYSGSYNCSVGFTIDSNTQLTIRELNKTGYNTVRGVCMYGIR